MIRTEIIAGARLYCGDAREVMAMLIEAGELVDVVVTDPPYSSGGAMRSDRALTTSHKYRLKNVARTDPNFSGDSRDQRALMFWCSDWMGQALRMTRAGGAMLCFIDWRNLPCIIDACQIGGWIYRGIVPWDKTEQSRPDKGWFRAQVEYIITASNGALLRGGDAPGICAPGFFRHPVSDEKQHTTEKPAPLMRDLLRTREDWAVVLDPFMGAGTTGVAAVQLGRKFIGIELEPRYFDRACRRIAAEYSEPIFDRGAVINGEQANLL